MVWEDSFMEFKMQFQRFNHSQKYFSFGTLLAENPQAAQLHFLVGGSVLGYLEQLNGIIPDITDNLGQRFMPIADCRFEIINADIRDIGKYEVAFNFYSGSFLWHGNPGAFLLVSTAGKDQLPDAADSYDTYLFQPRAYVSIDKLSNTL